MERPFFLIFVKYFYSLLTLLAFFSPVSYSIWLFLPAIILMWISYAFFKVGVYKGLKFNMPIRIQSRSTSINHRKIFLLFTIVMIAFIPLYIKYYTGANALTLLLSFRSMAGSIKGTNLPGEFADKGYEGVITITTKQAAAAQRAAAKSAREGIEAGRAGIEAAREGLKLARKYMSSDDWKQAQKALDKAQKELEAARKETSAQLSEMQKAVGTSLKLSADAGHADKVTIQGTPESSVSVYKGQVTLKGGFPDGMLIRINGREASKEDVERLESGKIKRMEVYKGDEAVKRYGEKGRNGVVEIRARR